MILNDFGKIVQDCWNEIPAHFDNVETAAFMVMPNHIHGIVHLIDATRRGKACLAPTVNLVLLYFQRQGYPAPKFFGHILAHKSFTKGTLCQ